MEKKSIGYPDVAPTISIDNAIGQHYDLEFDIYSYVSFLRSVGLSDADICRTRISVETPSEESKEMQKRCGPLDGQYLDSDMSIRLYWESISNNFQKPLERTQNRMNQVLVHETGHLVDFSRPILNGYFRRRIKYGIEDVIGVGSLAAIGLAGLAAVSRQMPGRNSGKISKGLQEVGDKALLAGIPGAIAALTIRNFAGTRPGIKYWKDYSVTERFATRFEEKHKGQTPAFIKLTSKNKP